MPDQSSHWLKGTYKTGNGYQADAAKWQYVDDVATGAFLDDDKVQTYLPQRLPKESQAAYTERTTLARGDMLYPRTLGSLTGMIAAVEKDTTRRFESGEGTLGMGEPEDPTSIAYRLTHDYDGDRTPLRVFWRRALGRLLRRQEQVFIVEGPALRQIEGEDSGSRTEMVGSSHVRMIPPQNLTARRFEGGKLVECIAKGSTIIQADLTQEAEKVDTYTHYRLDGWTRYRFVKDQFEPVVMGEGSYAFYDTAEARRRSDESRRRLPVFIKSLPFDTHIGYLLARSAMAIFNMGNRRNGYINRGNYARFMDESPDEDGTGQKEKATTADAHLEEIEGGETYHQMEPGHKAYWLAPPMDPAEEARLTLEQLRKEFTEDAFMAYANSAREMTATEVRQDFRSGIEALLSLLTTTIDGAEMEAGFLLEQVEFPDSPDLWNQYFVQRSQSFEPVDPWSLFKTQKEALYGTDTLPVTEEMEVNFIKDTAAVFGWPVSKDEDIIKVVKERRLIAGFTPASGDGAAGDIEDILNDLG